MDSMEDRRKRGKMHKVMSEYKQGGLKSGSGHMVTNRKQAVAIAMSESRKGRRRGKRRSY